MKRIQQQAIKTQQMSYREEAVNHRQLMKRLNVLVAKLNGTRNTLIQELFSDLRCTEAWRAQSTANKEN